MAGSEKKGMVCAKAAAVLRGGICDACQEKFTEQRWAATKPA
jgi:hypothetical protein